MSLLSPSALGTLNKPAWRYRGPNRSGPGTPAITLSGLKTSPREIPMFSCTFKITFISKRGAIASSANSLVPPSLAVSTSGQTQHEGMRLTGLADSWVVSISDRFQYGQKNKTGDSRWVVLHDKGNKPYQVRGFHHLIVLEFRGSSKDIASLYDHNHPGCCC